MVNQKLTQTKSAIFTLKQLDKRLFLCCMRLFYLQPYLLIASAETIISIFKKCERLHCIEFLLYNVCNGIKRLD